MKIAKWFLYIAGYLVISIVAPLLSTFVLPGSICWKEPIAGPMATTLIVLHSFLAAPEYKRYAAFVGCLVGVFWAYQIPEMSWYPECHPKAYRSTSLPLVSMYITGLVTLIAVVFYSFTQRNKLTQPTANEPAE